MQKLQAEDIAEALAGSGELAKAEEVAKAIKNSGKRDKSINGVQRIARENRKRSRR